MPAAGVPPKMEYQSGEIVPYVQDQNTRTLEITRWRCMNCGEIIELQQGGVSFAACNRCGGQRWGFVDARSRW